MNGTISGARVAQKTVHRWTDPDGIQARDANADNLTSLSYNYDLEETARVLHEDVEKYRRTVYAWLKQADSNINPSPSPTIQQAEMDGERT